ncbi:MAG: histidine--tRNA ligase [Deltaproteobacteria bacterium]|nr:histidine--tRNA ligase [Deltaproteobacteria bacterium]
MASFDLSPPSGTRDFLPEDAKARERVMRTIKDVFERYGFGPLETPAFERIEILTGKYGDEGDKLIFKILKRGEKAALGEVDFTLRYDLTVPLARVVGEYRHKLGAIWKRYQIAPVWRADRPAKGRFREFYQCDVDVIGAKGPVADAEVLLAVGEALATVGLPGFTIKLNSRNVLRGLMEAYGIAAEQQKATLIGLDKLDKMSLDDVMKELEGAGIAAASISALAADIGAADPAARVRDRVAGNATGALGLAEVDALYALVAPTLAGGAIKFEPFLARGLDYYTGQVFEVAAPGLNSSIASGGRYDGLVGMFSKDAVPACGGSLGLDRILLLLDEKAGARPPLGIPQVVVAVWDEAARGASLKLASDVRATGASVEVFAGDGDIGKQLKYAVGKQARVALIVGPDEAAKGLVQVKDLASKGQQQVPRAEVAAAVAALLAAK